VRITTTRFGEIEVEKSEIITFPQGILGFEGVQQYILLGDVQPFGFLQAVEDPDLTFVVIDPTALVPDYRVEVPRTEMERIGLKEPSEAVALAIVTIPSDPQKMTANLQAPVVISTANRQARQLVLTEGTYNMRHPVLQSIDQSA